MALPTPSPTLYVSGLETKTKKPGEQLLNHKMLSFFSVLMTVHPELRAQLYALFNPYGRV